MSEMTTSFYTQADRRKANRLWQNWQLSLQTRFCVLYSSTMRTSHILRASALACVICAWSTANVPAPWSVQATPPVAPPVVPPAAPADKPAGNAGDAKPVDAKPVDAKPADAKPADAKPVDAKPVDAKPADAKPADAKKPVAKATGAKPVDPRKPVAKAKKDETAKAKSESATTPPADVPPELQKYAKMAASPKFKEFTKLAAERQDLFVRSSALRMAMRGTEPTEAQIDEQAKIQRDIGKIGDRMDAVTSAKSWTQEDFATMDFIVNQQMQLNPIK